MKLKLKRGNCFDSLKDFQIVNGGQTVASHIQILSKEQNYIIF